MTIISKEIQASILFVAREPNFPLWFYSQIVVTLQLMDLLHLTWPTQGTTKWVTNLESSSKRPL